MLINLLQQINLTIQFISNLYAQFPLSTNTMSQPIQMLILILKDVFVVFVDLLVIKRRVVWSAFIWIVAVGCVAGCWWCCGGRESVCEAD